MSDESQSMTLEDMLSDKELPEETSDEQTTGEESESEGDEAKKAEESKEGETGKDDDSTPESDASKDKDTEEEGKKSQEEKDDKDDESWTKTAVLDERRKRQALQQELDALKSQSNKGDEATQEKEPDWYDEPDKAASLQERKFQDMLFTNKVELSQDMMRSQNEDYDEMEQKFFDLCQENPSLRQELRSAANPARFAYETAKKATEYEQMQDVETYKAKLKAEARKEVEEEVRKEQEEKQQKLDKKRAAADPSLASANSKGGLSSNDYSGPTPLNEILK